jgi:histidinol-phosphate aminotransferase
MRMSDIEELLRARSDGLIVVDEAYADFADDSAVRLLDRYANLLVLRSFSKSFSLAGLRLGLALGAAETIAELVKVKDSYNVDRLAIVAGVAALEDAAWMEENARRVKATRAWLSEELRRLGFEVPQSQANFVFARKPGKDLAPVYLALKRQGILVRHFPIDGLRDALRITVGTDDEVRRLLAALTGIQEL